MLSKTRWRIQPFHCTYPPEVFLTLRENKKLVEQLVLFQQHCERGEIHPPVRIKLIQLMESSCSGEEYGNGLKRLNPISGGGKASGSHMPKRLAGGELLRIHLNISDMMSVLPVDQKKN